MKRGHSELLKGVKTKRKAMKAGAHHPYLPYFKLEASYHSPPAQPTKCINQTDLFEKCQSPEADQAVDNIHHGIQNATKESNLASGNER